MSLISQSKEIRAGRYYLAYFKRKYWLKLLHQDLTNGRLFDNITQATNYINDTDNDLYSIIGDISNNNVSEKFEFIMNYPLLGKYIHFKQLNFPMFEADENGKKEVKGFELIHPQNLTNFHGLAKSMYIESSKCTPSLFDTAIGSIYFSSCVGMTKCKTDWNQNYLPSAFGETKIMSFWMCIGTHSFTFLHQKQLSQTLIKFISSLFIICK